MKVREILTRKGHDVVTAAPDLTVQEAIRLLVKHGIGSLVVMKGDRIEGILTERDILRLVDRDPAAPPNRRIETIMTRNIIFGVADDDVYYLMEVMTRNRVRHLPIVEDGTLVGIVSIGDVVNHIRQDVEAENRYLRDYVHGVLR